MKKVMIYTFSLFMLTSVLLLYQEPITATNIDSFTDIDYYMPEYENSLRFVVEQYGVLNGTSSTTFSPSDPITRCDVIVALCRVFNVDISEHSNKANPFTDVPSDAYYINQVKWVYYEGIVNGTSATQFSPLVPMQRQGLCLVFVRFCDHFGISLPASESSQFKFTDDASIGSLYKSSVYIMYRAGIINGGDNGNFFLKIPC